MRKRRRSVHADAVVALDGTGHFRSIGEAINNAPSHTSRRYVIYVKQGEYKENVDVKRKRRNIALIGDGMGKTVISGSRSFASGWTTFRSATFGENLANNRYHTTIIPKMNWYWVCVEPKFRMN